MNLHAYIEGSLKKIDGKKKKTFHYRTNNPIFSQSFVNPAAEGSHMAASPGKKTEVPESHYLGTPTQSTVLKLLTALSRDNTSS